MSAVLCFRGGAFGPCGYKRTFLWVLPSRLPVWIEWLERILSSLITVEFLVLGVVWYYYSRWLWFTLLWPHSLLLFVAIVGFSSGVWFLLMAVV